MSIFISMENVGGEWRRWRWGSVIFGNICQLPLLLAPQVWFRLLSSQCLTLCSAPFRPTLSNVMALIFALCAKRLLGTFQLCIWQCRRSRLWPTLYNHSTFLLLP